MTARRSPACPRQQIARKGIARTFQIVRMLPSLTVLENVMAGGVFGHERRWGAELDDMRAALLRARGLAERGDAPVSALTYIDQKRRRTGAGAGLRSEVLLLDEWLAGLNPTELRTGIALIERCAPKGAPSSSSSMSWTRSAACATAASS